MHCRDLWDTSTTIEVECGSFIFVTHIGETDVLRCQFLLLPSNELTFHSMVVRCKEQLNYIRGVH